MTSDPGDDPHVAAILLRQRWRDLLADLGTEVGRAEALAAMMAVALQEHERTVGTETLALLLSDAADLLTAKCGHRPALAN